MTILYVFRGPNKHQSYELKSLTTYIGRAADNDIRLKDKNVSAKHLRIIRKATHKTRDTCFVEDLHSKNGTFLNGNRISPGIEIKVKDGTPILIGKSLLCVGEGCLEDILPFLDSVHLSGRIVGNDKISLEHSLNTYQENIDFIRKVSELPTESRNIRQVLEKILEYIFDLLRRIDRGFFILIDPETGEIRETISRLRKSSEDSTTNYSRDVVDQVLRRPKPVVVFEPYGEEEDGFSETVKLSKIRSVMCVPMMSGSKTTGVLYLDSLKEPCGFQKEDLLLLVYLSRRIAPAIEKVGFQRASR